MRSIVVPLELTVRLVTDAAEVELRIVLHLHLNLSWLTERETMPSFLLANLPLLGDIR
jgi:hypothetical protein